ncbi:DMT family transporter [Thalassococcus sp. CAU 1522]|uniref:DMT family transporter n=1 Tax=Thalassococcus arenae TaxID=2851652 RepID=A0ABS6NAL9_9RHOB|nr:DMT family transporter [Thalassococcus arenae]MBV2361064.1 DMT family transporter [Thalassococcus arenae]
MDNLRGIGWMVLAMALFAIEDALIKQAAADIPAGQILMLLGLGGGAFFAAIARLRGLRLLSPVLLSGPVMIRNLTEMIGTLGFVTAITTIPLSTASAVLQATPLVMTMGAALIFAEPVGWRRWSAIGIGFAGVLVIIRPGLAGFDPYALFAVLGVLGLAGRDLAARAVPRAIPNVQLAAYGFLMLIPTGAVLLLFGAPWSPPTPDTWALIALAVAVGVAGYYAITTASRTGDVSVVTPFRYSRLIFALLVGMTVFGERPDALTYLGAVLVIGSGLYTFMRERRVMTQSKR